jgi:hypothetical protein
LKMFTITSGFIPLLVTVLRMNMNLWWNQPPTPLKTLWSACSDLCRFRGSLHFLAW